MIKAFYLYKIFTSRSPKFCKVLRLFLNPSDRKTASFEKGVPFRTQTKILSVPEAEILSKYKKNVAFNQNSSFPT